jgi:hypothetical protein
MDRFQLSVNLNTHQSEGGTALLVKMVLVMPAVL